MAGRERSKTANAVLGGPPHLHLPTQTNNTRTIFFKKHNVTPSQSKHDRVVPKSFTIDVKQLNAKKKQLRNVGIGKNIIPVMATDAY